MPTAMPALKTPPTTAQALSVIAKSTTSSS